MTTTMTDLATGRTYVFSEALPGRDAYEEALARGFQGTREEWLAHLRGFAFDPEAANWEVDRAWLANTAVRHRNSIWLAKVANTGIEPGTDPATWMMLISGPDTSALDTAIAQAQAAAAQAQTVVASAQPYAADAQVAAAMQSALNLGGVLSREMQVLRQRVLAQGVVLLTFKHVVTGMVLSKSASARTLHLSQSGTVGAGVSRAEIDGRIVSLPDAADAITVPPNETGAAVDHHAYLIGSNGSYGVQIAREVPDTGLPLYRVSVPAGDTGNSLSAVTLTDLRVIMPSNTWLRDTPSEAAVVFPEPLPDAGYAVSLDVESASDPAAAGLLVVVLKARNGFVIRQTGRADNLMVRWTLLNPLYK